MADHIKFLAGQTADLKYTLSLNHFKAGIGETKADILAKFAGYWCQHNCVDEWSVLETNKDIKISFDSQRDLVLFHISTEYERFAGSGSVICRTRDNLEAAA